MFLSRIIMRNIMHAFRNWRVIHIASELYVSYLPLNGRMMCVCSHVERITLTKITAFLSGYL